MVPRFSGGRDPVSRTYHSQHDIGCEPLILNILGTAGTVRFAIWAAPPVVIPKYDR
jgi:hypothetical protein